MTPKTDEELTEEVVQKLEELDDDEIEQWAENHPESDRVFQIIFDLLVPEPNRRYKTNPNTSAEQ